MAQHKGSITAAVIWMFVLSILLFWLPLLGPLIAGFVGGRKAGNTGSAILAVCLPAIVLAALTMFASTALLGMPVFGLFAAMGTFVMVMAHVVPLLIGAVVGGATA